MSNFLAICEQAARAGGAVLQDWVDRISIHQKGPKDLVTEADLASQQAIRDVVLSAFPDHLFLGEEGDAPDGDAGEEAELGEGVYRWIVDPLDGTLNYVRGLPSYAVSVALERGGEILVGVVFDPLLQECFSASAKNGAYMNGRRIHCRPCHSLEEALIAVSFAADVPRGSIEVRRFIEVLHTAQALRRSGSAALNLCYVGAGRLDGYFASSVRVWDVAAAVLVAREAGAMISSIIGGPFELRQPNLAAAATAELHAELLKALSQAE